MSKDQQGRSSITTSRRRPIPAAEAGGLLPPGPAEHAQVPAERTAASWALSSRYTCAQTRDNLAREGRGRRGSCSPGRKAVPSPQEAAAVGYTVFPQKLFFSPNPWSLGV